MKQGTTTTLSFNLKIKADSVLDVVFAFKEKIKSEDLIFKKTLSKDGRFENGKVKIPLSQDDTLALPNVFFIEAQIIFTNRSTTKSHNFRYKMEPTLYTTEVTDSSSDGLEEIIDLDFDEVVEAPASYEKLNDLPELEGKVIKGKKTAHDYGLAKEADLEETNEAVAAVSEKVDDSAADIEDIKADINELDDTKAPKSRRLGYDLTLEEDVSAFNFAKAIIDALIRDAGSTFGNLIRRFKDFFFDKEDIDDILLDFGNGISCSIDPLTYVCTFELKNNNTVISTAAIDLPIESMVISADYDKTTKEIVLTLQSGNTVRVNVADIVSGLIDIQTFNQEEQITVTLSNEIKSDAIGTSEYYMLFINSAELPSGSTLKMYPKDIHGNELSPINISVGRGYPVYRYSSVKLYYSGSENEVDLTFTLDNLVVRSREFTTQIENLEESKQDLINDDNKLDSDLLDDTNSTKKLTTQTEKDGWNGKEDPTNIEKDSTSTTVSLTLENNTENRYTEDLSDLTIALPQTIDDDFISGVVFVSGTIPTAMTYDSSIKWTGDDVNNNVFVPAADKTYNFIIWNDGININAIVRGVA